MPADVRALIRTMAASNPRWGAPRIHGELLKLGIDVSQATVAKYMGRRHRPHSQTWRTFLSNHVGQIVAADFFVVPTATSRLVFALLLVVHDRRRIRHVSHPSCIRACRTFADRRSRTSTRRSTETSAARRRPRAFGDCSTRCVSLEPSGDQLRIMLKKKSGE